MPAAQKKLKLSPYSLRGNVEVRLPPRILEVTEMRPATIGSGPEDAFRILKTHLEDASDLEFAPPSHVILLIDTLGTLFVANGGKSYPIGVIRTIPTKRREIARESPEIAHRIQTGRILVPEVFLKPGETVELTSDSQILLIGGKPRPFLRFLVTVLSIDEPVAAGEEDDEEDEASGAPESRPAGDDDPS